MSPEKKIIISHLAGLFAKLLLIIIAAIGVYAHTLDVPFYLDDFSSIRENPAVYESAGFTELWGHKPYRMRYVSYLSFALNYRLHQFDVSGYHMVNIAIHTLMGMAIFWFATVLLRTPRMADKTTPVMTAWLPLLTALLFVLHPLHTQAVTYVVQRMASMAALFYVLAMAGYLQARLAQNGYAAPAWIALCGVFLGLGLLSKQNILTLPVALLLLELVFFTQTWRKLAIGFVGITVLLGAMWYVVASSMGHNPWTVMSTLQAISKETTEISRWDYLATQTEVIWWYVHLFLWPVNLHLDYDFPVVTFGDSLVHLAVVLHVLVWLLAVKILWRWPLAGFAILFYYLAHSVESSLIPIVDVIFEHRTYLPDVGLCLLSVWLLLHNLPPRHLWRLSAATAGIVLLGVLGTLTWQRNQMWRDPVVLWEDNTRLAPEKARPWALLGKHLLLSDQPREAVEKLHHALAIQRRKEKIVNVWDVINLVVGLKRLGYYDQALQTAEQTVRQPVPPLPKSKLLINMGNIYYQLRRFSSAEQHYRQAIEVYPHTIIGRANLASVLAQTGRYAEAKTLLEKVIELDPGNEYYRKNYGALRKALQ